MGRHSAQPLPLEGRNVLIVEDETIISLEIEHMLQDLGCGIAWHAANVSQALKILGEHRPDLALLDVNLGSEKVFPVAEALMDRSIPFVFATGYGREGLPLKWAGWPVIRKPYLASKLAVALSPLLR